MKEFFKKQDNLIILFVSIVAFIAGCLAKHTKLALIIVLLADIFFFYPEIKQLFKRKGRTNMSTNLKAAKKKIKDLKKKKKYGKLILLIILGLIIMGIIFVSLFGAYIVINAPKFDPNDLYASEPSTVYDIDGNEVAKLGAEIRENITYNQLPEILIDAIVATEDSNFFQHNGFDLPRFMVASVKQVLTHGGGGASTLTMQVAKNDVTKKKYKMAASGFQGLVRKFTDIYMAVFQIEKKYSKQEILEFYVNSYYLGSGAYGVEQASLTYFGKEAKDLTLPEAALIAGLFQAPDAYDPYKNPEKALQRRNQVLRLMKRHNYITEDEFNAATSIKIEDMLNTTSEEKSSSSEWQAFLDTVVSEVKKDTGLNPNVVSMEIYTSLDRDKQRTINDVMDGKTYEWQNDFADAGIIVQDVNTGEIVAVGAGRNRNGKLLYNNATMLNKQIGSTSKPLYDYAPGIEYQNWSTYQLFVDEPYTYSDGTEINNWDRKYNGLMTLRTALAQSRNIPALKAFQMNKNSDISKFVKSVGLHPEVGSNGIIHEAHSIGGYTGESPKNMAAAYAVFGNGGYYITPHSYRKVIINSTKEVIEKKVEKTRVLSEETAYMMASLLQSSAQYGLGAQASIGGATFGAKTGTSNFDSGTIKRWGFGDNAVNDLWVDGVSPDYSISVWYGYKERTVENKKYYSTSFTIAHRKLFQAVAKGVFKKGSSWTKPEGVVEVAIEMGSWPAALATDATPESNRVTELFKSGTEPTEGSSKYTKLPDVTGLKGSVNNTKLTLTWNGVTVANKSQLSSLYKNASNVNDGLGDIIYKVYGEDESGNLTHLGDATGTTFEVELNVASATKYVVKTAYSNYAGNMSNGTSTTISIAGIKPSSVSAKLATDLYTTVALNSNVTPSNNDVIITADDRNVTSKAKVNITITYNGNKVDKIDTTSTGKYNISYVISYADQTFNLSRTIEVK